MKVYEIGTGYTSIPAKVPAATESVVEELVRAFMAHGQPVEIVDIADPQRTRSDLPITEVKVPALFTKADIRLGLVHKLKRVVYSLCLASKLKKILKQADEKVVLHFHNQYNLFFFFKRVPAKWRNKAIVAYTNHNGVWSLPLAEAEETLKKRYFQELDAIPKADVVFALNGRMRDNMVARLAMPEERVVLSRNGVNPRRYHPLPPADIAAAKEAYGLTGKRVILQVGAVNENKGQGRSLEALAPLLKEQTDVVFAYVGDIVSQEYQQEIIALAERLQLTEQVRYLGAVSPGGEMNTVYNMAEATVFSSCYEGFPLACIESMSAGVPVLLHTDIPFSFGEGSIKWENTQTAETVLGEALAGLKQRAVQTVMEQFTWESITADHMALWDDLAKEA